MRVGLVDIGSNTVRLAVYRLADGEFQELHSEKVFLRLVEYRNQGVLSKEGISRLLLATADLIEQSQIMCADNICCFATEAIRGAENKDEIIDILESTLNIKVELLSGRDEALYGVIGAVRGLGLNNGLYVDLGGGSAEITRLKDSVIVNSISLPLGALVLLNRFVTGVLPQEKELQSLSEHVAQVLSSVLWIPSDSAEKIFVSGGTARAMARLAENNAEKKDLNGYTLNASKLSEMVSELLQDEAEGIKKLNRVAPGRVTTMIPGIEMFRVLAQASGLDQFVVSKLGIREGYLIRKFSDILAHEPELELLKGLAIRNDYKAN